MAKDVSTVILETLASVGVRQIFGIPGDAINGLVDAVRRQDLIEFVTVRHEEAAAFAASAQAKLTGTLGVVVGTAGPGAAHLLNGLYDASLDSAPVLAITGQVESSLLGADSHQELDLQDLFGDVAAFTETLVNPEQMPELIHAAVRQAIGNRTVSHLVIPSDLALAPVPESNTSFYVPGGWRARPCDEDLEAAAHLIGEASAMTLLVGIGARDAAAEVLALAEHLHAPIIKTLRAKDLIPDEHPLVIGGLGLLGTEPAVHAIERTDLLLMVGTDFPYEDFYPEKAKTIQIDIDRTHIGRRTRVDVGLIGESEESIRALLPIVSASTDRRHLERAQAEMREWLEQMRQAESDDSVPIRPQRVAAEIARAAGPGTIYLCDTGAVTVWAARNLRLQEGDRFTLSSNLASMAFALPAAIGAQFAYPDSRVVALAGDGGFSMLIGDLITAVAHDLPITVVVFNNSKLGLIQMEQEAEGMPEFATRLANPDFGEVARAMGAEGHRVEAPDELGPALATAMASPRPAVVDVVVNPEEITMPPRIEPRFVLGYARAKLKEIAGKGVQEPGLAPLKEPVKRLTDRL